MLFQKVLDPTLIPLWVIWIQLSDAGLRLLIVDLLYSVWELQFLLTYDIFLSDSVKLPTLPVKLTCELSKMLFPLILFKPLSETQTPLYIIFYPHIKQRNFTAFILKFHPPPNHCVETRLKLSVSHLISFYRQTNFLFWVNDSHVYHYVILSIHTPCLFPEINRFYRSLRLMLHYLNKVPSPPTTNTINYMFHRFARSQSPWTTSGSSNALDIYIANIKYDIRQLSLRCHNYSNLTNVVGCHNP